MGSYPSRGLEAFGADALLWGGWTHLWGRAAQGTWGGGTWGDLGGGNLGEGGKRGVWIIPKSTTSGWHHECFSFSPDPLFGTAKTANCRETSTKRGGIQNPCRACFRGLLFLPRRLAFTSHFATLGARLVQVQTTRPRATRTPVTAGSFFPLETTRGKHRTLPRSSWCSTSSLTGPGQHCAWWHLREHWNLAWVLNMGHVTWGFPFWAGVTGKPNRNHLRETLFCANIYRSGQYVQ